MKRLTLVSMVLMLAAPAAFAQKAYDCGGENAYELAKDIVKRTVKGAKNLSVVDEGVEQTSMLVGEGGEANVEKWDVLVKYNQEGQSGIHGQSFQITYVVTYDTNTYQANCRFRSAVETWTE